MSMPLHFINETLRPNVVVQLRTQRARGCGAFNLRPHLSGADSRRTLRRHEFRI